MEEVEGDGVNLIVAQSNFHIMKKKKNIIGVVPDVGSRLFNAMGDVLFFRLTVIGIHDV